MGHLAGPTMTEAEWRSCQHIWPLYEFIDGRLSDRRARLFAVACCRRVWGYLADERSRRAVEMAELCADGLCPRDEQERAAEEAFQVELDEVGQQLVVRGAAFAAFCAVDADRTHLRQSHDAAAQVATDAAGYPPLPGNHSPRQTARAAEKAAQAEILRDIVGNPFRPVPADPSWHTVTVAQLAAAIYAERAFDRLPILADALEEAGCSDSDILNHCRRDGRHVRGCWVVDLLLGKS